MPISDNDIIKLYDILPSFAGSFVKNKEDQEDLVQDTLVKILENRESFQGKADISTWARRIMENVLIDKKRKESQDALPSAIALDDLPEETLSYNPWIKTEEKEENTRIVLGMIKTLPDSMKELATMIYLEGYTYKEAAEALKISPKTVDNKLQRIKERLRKSHGIDKEQEESNKTEKKLAGQGATPEQAIPREGNPFEEAEAPQAKAA